MICVFGAGHSLVRVVVGDQRHGMTVLAFTGGGGVLDRGEA